MVWAFWALGGIDILGGCIGPGVTVALVQCSFAVNNSWLDVQRRNIQVATVLRGESVCLDYPR